MDALTYLQKHGREKTALVAEKAGTKYVYFSQIAYEHRKPSPRLAQALVAASEGELTLHELRPDIYGAQASV